MFFRNVFRKTVSVYREDARAIQRHLLEAKDLVSGFIDTSHDSAIPDLEAEYEEIDRLIKVLD